MLSTFLATALVASTMQTPTTWYGKATVTFETQFSGNPYDPAVNDVRVLFIPENGPATERLAYFDGVESAYKAVLVAPQPGSYRAVLVHNGKQVQAEPKEKSIVVTEKLPNGFIRRDPTLTNRFKWDSGEIYYPIGINLGWQGGDILPMPQQLEKMGKAGMNWSRIWACHWDGKNPWWPQDSEKVDGQIWPPALERWDDLVEASEKSGIAFQMVLFHHGAFSSTVNPNWPDHPWNKKNGGFLANAADFFTDAEAKRRTKMWLRYAVARWGHSPSVMAWELFNEVEWVDARYQNRWGDIAAWHKEMADYLRSLDPYKHLVTTSSPVDQQAVFEPMDYIQPHTYPVDVASAVASQEIPKDKPMFFGEFGPGGQADARKAIRDGIFASLTSNHAGAAQYWYWDILEKNNLYDEYTKAKKALDLSGIANRPYAMPLAVNLSSDTTADLVFAPVRGWENSTQMAYDLTPGVLPRLSGTSSYLQGTAHPEMQPGPAVFRFTAPKAGTFKVRIVGRSRQGAHVRLKVNDKLVAEKSYAATEQEARGGDTLEAPFAAGPNVVTIENVGADWAQIGSYTITGFGPPAKVMAIGDDTFKMIRLTAVPGATNPTVTIGGLSFPSATTKATVLRLDNGETSEVQLSTQGSAIRNFAMPAEDVVIVVKG